MDPAVVDALASDDKQRSDFLKACLLKVGLKVSMEEKDLPSLSPIYFSTLNGTAISKTTRAWYAASVAQDGGRYIKGEHDTFQLATPTNALSMTELAEALSERNGEMSADSASKNIEDPNDKIVDYDKIPKQIISYHEGYPSSKDTPYFNHELYFDSISNYTKSTSHLSSQETQIGQHLMYGEVVTSTSTLLEK